MKLITGGVGVSHVSNSPSGLRIYVNDKFAAAHNGVPGSPQLTLRKATRAPEGWDLVLSPGDKAVTPSWTGRDWVMHLPWNSVRRQPPGLPIGGKTEILQLREQDNCIVVTIPGQLNPSGKIGAIQRAKERRAAEARGFSSNALPVAAPPTCGVAELQDAIRVINACIESMGDSLVLSLEGEPRRLRAMIELG